MSPSENVVLEFPPARQRNLAPPPRPSHSRRLRIVRPVFWNHHRGGWRQVVEAVAENLCCPDGVRLLTAVEETMFSGEAVNEPWVGFVHEVPHHNQGSPDLSRLFALDAWKASLPNCRGIWTLSDYIANFVKSVRLPVPVERVYYPVATPRQLFSFVDFCGQKPRQLLFIGEHLRCYEPFYRLRAPGFSKVLLKCLPIQASQDAAAEAAEVRVLDHVPDDEYDRLLARSLVFLNLFDAPANTTVVECLVRNTPVLINRVGSVVDYLGADYPFFYSTVEEASHKLQDDDLIVAAAAHLSQSEMKRKVTFPFFLSTLQDTDIYKSLPIPRSQRSR